MSKKATPVGLARFRNAMDGRMQYARVFGRKALETTDVLRFSSEAEKTRSERMNPSTKETDHPAGVGHTYVAPGLCTNWVDMSPQLLPAAVCWSARKGKRRTEHEKEAFRKKNPCFDSRRRGRANATVVFPNGTEMSGSFLILLAPSPISAMNDLSVLDQSLISENFFKVCSSCVYPSYVVKNENGNYSPTDRYRPQLG